MTPEASEPPRRVLIVANPISGRGRGEHVARELRRALEARGVATELHLTRARGDGRARVAAADAGDRIVAVGGDGTLSEVLQGLPDPSRPVGLLPCGTANVLAHALGLAREVPAAVETFLHGREQALDVARVGERLSHLVVGVGMDGHIVRAVEERRRGPITKLAYLTAAARVLRSYRPEPMRVWIDGEECEHSVGLVWAANTPRYADLLHLAPGTRLDDGLWEVYLFPSASLPQLVTAFLRGLVSHLPGGPVVLRRARRLRVEAANPVPYQIDGDLGGTTPLALELLAERFRILVPGPRAS